MGVAGLIAVGVAAGWIAGVWAGDDEADGSPLGLAALGGAGALGGGLVGSLIDIGSLADFPSIRSAVLAVAGALLVVVLFGALGGPARPRARNV